MSPTRITFKMTTPIKDVLIELFNDLDSIHDWADYPQNKYDCVCSKDKYDEIKEYYLGEYNDS